MDEKNSLDPEPDARKVLSREDVVRKGEDGKNDFFNLGRWK